MCRCCFRNRGSFHLHRNCAVRFAGGTLVIRGEERLLYRIHSTVLQDEVTDPLGSRVGRLAWRHPGNTTLTWNART